MLRSALDGGDVISVEGVVEVLGNTVRVEIDGVDRRRTWAACMVGFALASRVVSLSVRSAGA